MEQNLTTTQDASLVNSELINKARQLTGERGASMPYIPIIKINNKKEKKEVEIEGEKKIIEMLCDPSFTITKREDNEYKVSTFAPGEFEGVILKVRHTIREKYDETKKGFYSNEFSMNGFEDITLFDGSSKKPIGKGTYKEIKEQHTVGKNKNGNPIKDFSLFMRLYISVDDATYRLEKKVGFEDNWFKYSKSFGELDTFLAYKTIFKLEKMEGTIEYYDLVFERGEVVEIEKYINILKELDTFFFSSEKNFSSTPNYKKTGEVDVIELDEEGNVINETTAEEVYIPKVKSFDEPPF